ncbi:hypothetical protein BJ322DRAFT_1015238 [Thelephora terrestris]|uniref:rRNA-processing protein EFG1 n=1 Tax=Thelephora terrestris TaxID=56493 RepID=A0A9P6H2Q5_9AGAM|nr:hypothetical protein BJ322DRAFT_1015238 [Thelephora terrestris]
MGPSRTDASSSKRPSKHKKNGNAASLASEKTAGVSKLKAQLRQTRRLLAKDNIGADVRVETERRLRSLQKDLENAEIANKERALAVRYHKVKFFERQKLLRRINQVKKQTPIDGNRLFALRVDLNYVVHYPKLRKYVALFPAMDGEPTEGETEADAAREEVRKLIRDRMEKGEISRTPEECLAGSERG